MHCTNPFLSRRRRRGASPSPDALPIECVTIGAATLYRANCFDVLPTLHGIDRVVSDPPFGIGFAYRSFDDAPCKYEGLMTRLVPELIRATGNGPCFLWQSQPQLGPRHLLERPLASTRRTATRLAHKRSSPMGRLSRRKPRSLPPTCSAGPLLLRDEDAVDHPRPVHGQRHHRRRRRYFRQPIHRHRARPRLLRLRLPPHRRCPTVPDCGTFVLILRRSPRRDAVPA
jgi:hypothetical protein